MTTIVVSASNVANFPAGGGHFWVYMQYVHGLRQLGCDVYWLERFARQADADADASLLSTFFDRMAQLGLQGKVILYSESHAAGGDAGVEYIGISPTRARKILRKADLLLNFCYAIDPALLSLFRRTALVDIDPGLLQFWIAAGQLAVPPHDCYITTGETVGTAAALFSDCGLHWIYSRPPVCLDLWPEVQPTAGAFSTVSSWWGGGAKGHAEWIVGENVCYDNCKRVSFLEFLRLPSLTSARLELALNLSDDPEDVAERRLLEQMGWRIRHARDVAGSPEAYRSYIQQSSGEFSCAKPSCMKFQNAWVSDRTLCYLASGKPVVVQDTGPSAFLPNGHGMFRFSTLDGAAQALECIDSRYAWHCAAAREIAATYFDAQPVLARLLDLALAREELCVGH